MAALRLPTAVWSSLGKIPVVKKKGLVKKKLAFGMFHADKREVHLELQNSPAVDAQTFLHELTHVALWDSGVQQQFTHEQIEAVCDAVGTYFGGMMLAGCLTIRAPKESG